MYFELSVAASGCDEVEVEVVESMMVELEHGSGVVHKLEEEVNREATKHMVGEKADSV